MRRPRIFVTGRDNTQWALDTEYTLTRAALATFATIVPHPASADFVHTVDIDGTAYLIRRGLLPACVPVVGAINNHPARLIELPHFIESTRRAIFPIPLTDVAARDMDRLGLPYIGRASIAADVSSYRPIAPEDACLLAFKREIGLPDHRYVIGLLQRDSEGADLGRPKLQKGPDVFVALMMRLQRQVGSGRFHVLLGGPRRHWIRQALEENQIPYTFVGARVEGDDFPRNVLDKDTMCLLYNLLDLYVIPSRWEGAPRQLFDMLRCRRKIISTRVGIVPEILPAPCTFGDLDEALAIIERDMETNHLANFVEPARRVLDQRHTTEAVGMAWQDVYARLDPCNSFAAHSRSSRVSRYAAAAMRLRFAMATRSLASRGSCVSGRPVRLGFACATSALDGQGSVWALRAALGRGGFELCQPGEGARDAVLLHDSAVSAERPARGAFGVGPVIHLVDEPAAAALRCGESEVRRRFLAVQEIAAGTLMTSDYCLEDLAVAGLSPKNPWVLKPPPNKDLFFPGPEHPEAAAGPLRLLVLAYGPTCAELSSLEPLLGDPAYEVTIVSDREIPDAARTVVRAPDAGGRSRLARSSSMVIALPQLVESYQLLEYLACGLPILLHEKLARYRVTIGMAGLVFSDVETLRHAVRSVAAHRDAFSMTAALPHLDDSVRNLRAFLNAS